MLVLGLLLILGSAALGAGFVYDGSDDAKVEILGHTVHTTAAGIFFGGAATMLLFLLGLWLLTSSMGRSRRKRAERKEARRRNRDSVAGLEQERIQLAAENERLNEQLGSRRAANGTSTDGATAAPAPAGETDLRQSEATSSHSANGKHA